MDIKFYQCESCGDVVVKVAGGNEACPTGRKELVPGAVDAALEKHVPVVAVEGNVVRVQVGEVEHPMTEAHLIQTIVLVTDKGFQVAALTHEDAPVAEFLLAEGVKPLKVYEYCNLHGLWVKEL